MSRHPSTTFRRDNKHPLIPLVDGHAEEAPHVECPDTALRSVFLAFRRPHGVAPLMVHKLKGPKCGLPRGEVDPGSADEVCCGVLHRESGAGSGVTIKVDSWGNCGKMVWINFGTG